MLIVAFYARKNTLTPVLVGVVSNLAYLAIALGAVKIWHWGMIGLVLANSTQQIVHMTIMLVLLRRLFGKTSHADGQHRLTPTLVRTILAAVLMFAVAFLLSGLVTNILGNGLLPSLVALIIGGGGGGIVYLVCLRVLRVEEMSLVIGAVQKKLKRGR